LSFSPPRSYYRRADTAISALEVDATLEVVVGGHHNNSVVDSFFLKEQGAIAVPKGVAPGCLTTISPGGSPIIVTTSTTDNWKTLFDITLPTRQSDLVWVVMTTNDNSRRQQLSSWQRNMTVVIMPDYSVVAEENGFISSAAAEAHVVYGKHATTLKNILTRRGITNVSEIQSWTDLLQIMSNASITTDHSSSSGDTTNENENDTRVMISIPAINLVCTGRRQQQNMISKHKSSDSTKSAVQSAIVIGAGIIGSSTARALVAQRGISNVTVFDPTPTGVATPASWAWLNANQKPPRHYKLLNQMGLRAWRSDALLSQKCSSLEWCGTLVRTKKQLHPFDEGGYTIEGPISMERIRELEPEANFTDCNTNNNSTDADADADEPVYTYYFADEGHVDPQEAVMVLRQEAKDQGVSFVSSREERVVELVRDSNNGQVVVGVKTQNTNNGEQKQLLADVVIVAAGSNTSLLVGGGGVPLVHNPSRTYFSAPLSSTTGPILNRTLVDMVSSLYVAQRKDGTIVVGGGAVKFGLSADKKLISSKDEAAAKQLEMANELARQIAPKPIGNAPLTYKREVGSKPMPKDGFPIVGYVEPGLYAAVTHSGMTLSPLIGQLVAAEVKEQVSLCILDEYRPTRFIVVDDEECIEESSSTSLLKEEEDWQESSESEKYETK